MILFSKQDRVKILEKKLFIVGIIIALLNPIFSGLVMSFLFLTEPKLRKQGIILLAISFIWGIILAYLVDWLKTGRFL
jgi:threonine/homoserine/homoserine lactone efflux protein